MSNDRHLVMSMQLGQIIEGTELDKEVHNTF